MNIIEDFIVKNGCISTIDAGAAVKKERKEKIKISQCTEVEIDNTQMNTHSKCLI